jgi:hypothetical protein
MDSFVMGDDRPLTISIPQAGRLYFGLGRNGSYAAAKRGDIPTLRVGNRYRVPVRAMDRIIEIAAEKPKPPAVGKGSSVA